MFIIIRNSNDNNVNNSSMDKRKVKTMMKMEEVLLENKMPVKEELEQVLLIFKQKVGYVELKIQDDIIYNSGYSSDNTSKYRFVLPDEKEKIQLFDNGLLMYINDKRYEYYYYNKLVYIMFVEKNPYQCITCGKEEIDKWNNFTKENFKCKEHKDR